MLPENFYRVFEWDYTTLADAYLKRPDYSEEAISKMVQTAGLKENAVVCDVGAGVAHLTLMLADRGYKVHSVEPNDAMRANGIKRTEKFKNVSWYEGTGEVTGQPTHMFDLVTFGSSFNVTNRPVTLKETARILKPRGWFACMWNHRNLEDPIQMKIEDIIRSNIDGYSYGTRREDQTEIINASELFGKVEIFEGGVTHEQSIKDVVEAWRSHATLERQAGKKFELIVNEIEKMLASLKTSSIKVPYTTRVWMAQLK